jgi:WD40 repeat protein
LDLPASSNINANYPGKILGYSLDEQVGEIALLRSKGITANGVELFNLDLYDVTSEEAWTIVGNSTRISHMTLSPDGEWIAYKKEEDPYRIILLPTSERAGAGEVSISGDNSRILDGFEWSPDGRYLAWIDSSGIWLSDSRGFQPRLAVPNTIGMTYYGGEQSEILVKFDSLDWSPQGRYILTRVSPSQSEVSWMGIADTDRGLVSEIPGSFSPGDLIRNVEWTSEGDLLIVNGGSQVADSPTSLQIWRVVPTHDELIMPELNINLGNSLASPSAVSTLQEQNLAFPRKLDYRHYSFITVPEDPSDESVIFIYDTITQELDKVCKLPAGTIDVIWTGDGQGAIVVGRHNSAIIATLDSGADDLYQIMGVDSCCFRWLGQE